MEWGKIKTWLIVFLFAINVVLGVSIAMQMGDRARIEEESLSSAVSVLAYENAVFDRAVFFDMPVLMDVVQFQRDIALEEKAAKSILTEYTLDGGRAGIYRYIGRGQNQVDFYNGQFLIRLERSAFDTLKTYDDFAGLLSRAGFSLKGALVTEDGEGNARYDYVLKGGGPVMNLGFDIVLGQDFCTISGNWPLSDAVKTGQSLSRSELVISLRGQGFFKIAKVEPVWVQRTSNDGSMALGPCWRVEVDDNQLFLDATTGILG